ncbi:MAG: hypothetical protein GC172_03235 [Phycisphaera sp.]|nr:hypothetical protein [Phycisphaera sp.]
MSDAEGGDEDLVVGQIVRRPAQFLPSVICWVDVLGVSDALKAAACSGTEATWAQRYAADLKSMHDRLSKDYSGSGFSWHVISDAIVLSVPLAHDHPEFTTGYVFMDAAEAQFEFALKGRFMRGAITIGPLLVDGTVVVGSGLMRAQAIEAKEACFPRILVDDSIGSCLPEFLSYYSSSLVAPQRLHLAVDADDKVFVNYLYEAVESTDGDANAVVKLLEKHRLVVEQQLKQHANNPKVLGKYEWVAQYHNWFCNNFLCPTMGRGLQIADISARNFSKL